MRRANLKSRLRNPRSPASPRRADSNAEREQFSSSLFLDLTKGGLLVRPFVLDRLLPLGARTCGIYRRDNPVGVLVLFLGLSAKREQVFRDNPSCTRYNSATKRLCLCNCEAIEPPFVPCC